MSKTLHYHAYFNYLANNGIRSTRATRSSFFRFNLTRKFVRERISRPFMNNEAFVVAGIVLRPSIIEKITVYKSQEEYENLIMPDGRSPLLHSNNQYVANCFNRHLVKGVEACTDDFITSPPLEEGSLKKTDPPETAAKEQVFMVHGKDRSICVDLGKAKVCVVKGEDMGRKRILVVEHNGQEKWLERTEELSKHLKKIGIQKNDRLEALKFVNPRLRSLTKYDKSTDVGPKGVGRSEDKEV